MILTARCSMQTPPRVNVCSLSDRYDSTNFRILIVTSSDERLSCRSKTYFQTRSEKKGQGLFPPKEMHRFHPENKRVASEACSRPQESPPDVKGSSISIGDNAEIG